MKLEKRIMLFSSLGNILRQEMANGELDSVINAAKSKNQWFTVDNIKLSLNGIIDQFLKEDKLFTFINNYTKDFFEPSKSINVGIVAAGNIPLVCFQDIIHVLLAGQKVVLKPSSQDEVLINHIRNKMVTIDPSINEYFILSDRLNSVEAVIATGSGNTSRYFEYYFANKPNIIRKNRNSVAVITGKESKNQLANLGEDIFNYFGLGCRNVSHLLVPEGYDFTSFFVSIEYWNIITMHSKYNNNYDYIKSIYLVNRESHLDNGFLILKENSSLISPIAVLYFQYYKNLEEVGFWIKNNEEHIQVVVSTDPEISKVTFGKSQQPELYDYADNIDVLKFLKGAIS